MIAIGRSNEFVRRYPLTVPLIHPQRDRERQRELRSSMPIANAKVENRETALLVSVGKRKGEVLLGAEGGACALHGTILQAFR